MRTVLYRFYDSSDVLLYIGITDQVGVRFHSHSQKKPWWPEVAELKARWYDTRELAEEAERTAIATERPTWNIQHAIRPASDARASQVFEEFRVAHEEATALLPEIKKMAAEALRQGATVRQLADLTGLTDELFRRIARAEGVERLRPPTVGREVQPPAGE